MSLIHQSLECPSKLWFLLSIRRLLTGFTNMKEYRHFPVAIPRYLGALSFSDLHFPQYPEKRKSLTLNFWEYMLLPSWAERYDPTPITQIPQRVAGLTGDTWTSWDLLTHPAEPLPSLAPTSPLHTFSKGKCFPHAQQRSVLKQVTVSRPPDNTPSAL